MHTWEIFYPDAAATGLPVGRSRIDPTTVVWLHAAPERIAVTVRDAADRVVARGGPHAGDLGVVVLLPGGEAGVLRAWSNARDGSEWRWQLELSNRR